MEMAWATSPTCLYSLLSYRMCISGDLNGDGTGNQSHLSLFVIIQDMFRGDLNGDGMGNQSHLSLFFVITQDVSVVT